MQSRASSRKLPFTFVFIENKRGKDGPKLGKNGLTLGEQAMFLEFMQQIARPRNIQSYQKSVESLRNSTLYAGNPQVEDYSEKVWLSCSKRWCHTFRVQQAVNIVNTNNRIEAQNSLKIQLPSVITRQISFWHRSNDRGVVCARFISALYRH